MCMRVEMLLFQIIELLASTKEEINTHTHTEILQTIPTWMLGHTVQNKTKRNEMYI